MKLFHNIDQHGCPRCGHKNFLIKQLSSTIYITDHDGNVCDSKDEKVVTVGKCLECGKEFDAYPAFDSFIPLTSIRKHMIEYSATVLDKTNNMDETYIENPMTKRVGKC